MMDKEKLRKLAEKDPYDFNNKQFASFAARAAEQGLSVLLPGHAGIATFLRAPYRPDLSDCDIAIIGVPGRKVHHLLAKHGNNGHKQNA